MPTQEEIRQRYLQIKSGQTQAPVSAQPITPGVKPTPEQIRARYQELSSQIGTTTQTEPTQEFTTGQKVTEVAKGLGKSATGTFFGTAKLLERGVRGVERILTPKDQEEAKGLNKPLWADETQAGMEQDLKLAPGSLTEAQNPYQAGGKIAGDIAQFFAPTGVATRAGKALEAGLKARQVLRGVDTATKTSKALGFGARIAPQVASDASISAAQTGSLKKGAEMGAFTLGLPIVAKSVLGGVKKAVAPFAPNLFKGNKVLSKVKATAIDNLEDGYIEIATNNQGLKKKFEKAKAITEYKNRAGTEGVNPARKLAEMGIAPNQSGTRLDTVEQANKLREGTGKINTLVKAGVKDLEPLAGKQSLSALEEQAVAQARTPQNIDAGLATGLEKEIRQEFALLREAYGDAVDLSKLQDIKVARGKQVYDATRPNLGGANNLIRKTMQTQIEDVARKFGFDDIAQLNREQGDILEAANFLQSLDGKVLKGGRLKKYVFQIGGLSMGNTPLGRILGAFGGDALANLLISNSITTPRQRAILRLIEQEDPAVYRKALQWLTKNKISPPTRLMLPAPKVGAPLKEVSTITPPIQPKIDMGKQVVPRPGFKVKSIKDVPPVPTGAGEMTTRRVENALKQIEKEKKLKKGSPAVGKTAENAVYGLGKDKK